MASQSDKLKKYSKNAENLIANILTAPVMTTLAKDVANQIKKRTRLGYGVASGGKQIRLKPLTEKYIETRQDFSENLSEATTPKRSNLTATGQLLDAIQGTGATAKAEIGFNPNSRRSGLTGRGARGLTNVKLKEYVEKIRPFFGLTNAEVNRFVRALKGVLTQGAKKALVK